MALFDVTIPLTYETRLPIVSGKRAVIFEDNSNLVQSLSTNLAVISGVISCKFLTVAQRDTVMTFYTDNKDLIFTFDNPHDDLTYDLRFIDPAPTPVIDASYSPARYSIDLHVIGAPQ